MRVAALYDIHGMLTPLEAVLEEVEDTDLSVVASDVASGPRAAVERKDVTACFERVAIDRGER